MQPSRPAVPAKLTPRDVKALQDEGRAKCDAQRAAAEGRTRLRVSQAARHSEMVVRAEEKRAKFAALIARALALKRRQLATEDAVRLRVELECREAARVRKRAARARRKVNSRQQLAQAKQAVVRSREAVAAAPVLQVEHVGALAILRVCTGLFMSARPHGELFRLLPPTTPRPHERLL